MFRVLSSVLLVIINQQLIDFFSSSSYHHQLYQNAKMHLALVKPASKLSPQQVNPHFSKVSWKGAFPYFACWYVTAALFLGVCIKEIAGECYMWGTQVQLAREKNRGEITCAPSRTYSIGVRTVMIDNRTWRKVRGCLHCVSRKSVGFSLILRYNSRRDDFQVLCYYWGIVIFTCSSAPKRNDDVNCLNDFLFKEIHQKTDKCGLITVFSIKN